MLLLAVIPAGFYLLHVYDQVEQVRAANLRTLAKAAQTTSDILENAVGTVRTLARSLNYTCEFVRRQPRLSLLDKRCSDIGVARGAPITAAASLDIDRVQSQVQIVFDAEDSTLDMVFEVNLDAVLAEIPFGNALDLVLVVDDMGNVLRQHQLGTGGLGVGLMLEKVEKLSAYDSTEALDAAALKGSSSIHKVQLAGADYDLLCQPMPLGFVDSKTHDWTMCGLTSSERTFREALEVAPLLAILLFSMVMFGILTWPILKVFGLAQRERLRFGDLYFLLFGTWASIMVAVILLLGAATYVTLRTQTDESLGTLAAEVEERLQGELDDLQAQLERYDEELSRTIDQAKLTGDGMLQARNLLSSRPPEAPDLDFEVPELLVDNGSVHSDFEVAFWVRPCDGLQFLKATIRNDNTGQVRVDYRDYYQAVQQGRLWSPEGGRFVEAVRSATTGEFRTVLSVKSRVAWNVDSTFAAVMRDRGCSPDAGTVAAIQARLISTTTPIVSPGVGFAVVDIDGKVIFHSNEQRALFENLYEEMSGGERLAGLVRSRVEGPMTSYYLGRPHRVFVNPVAGTPWSVVAFSDNETIDSTVLEILADALAFAVLYLLLGVGLALFHFIVHGQEGLQSLWPDPSGKRHRWYAVGIVLAGAVLVVLAIVLLNETGQWSWDSERLRSGAGLLAVATLAPLLILVGLYACSRSIPASGARGEQRGLAHLRRSIAFALLLWLVIAVLPAYAFFRAAFDHGMPLLIKHEHMSLADQIVRRNCAVDEFYKGVEFQCANDSGSEAADAACYADARDSFLRARSSPEERDLYRSAMFSAREVRQLVPHAEAAAPFWALLARYKPTYNETVASLRSLDSNPAWERVDPAHVRLESYAFEFPFACKTSFTLVSKLPIASPPWGAVVLVGGMALLLLLAAWTRYVVRRIFFGELEAPTLVDAKALDEMLRAQGGNLGNRIVALIASPGDREKFVPSTSDPVVPAPAGDETGYMRCDLQRCWHDDAVRGAALAKIEAALAAHEEILLLSPTHPWDVLAGSRGAAPAPGSAQAPGIPATAPGEMSRWASVLDRFRVVTVALSSAPRRRSHGDWQKQLDRQVTDDWLAAELGAMPELASLFDGEALYTTRREALEKIVEKADVHYRALWNACSEDEKLVLIQLAQENVVNPRQTLAVRRLLQRGFLRRDPVLRLMNQSFALFVTRMLSPAEISAWERAADGLRWEHTRWALLGVLGVILLFLWTTQRDVFNTGVALLSGAAVGIPGLLKALEALTKVGGRSNK